MHINDYPEFIRENEIQLKISFNQMLGKFHLSALSNKQDMVLMTNSEVEVLDMKNLNYYIYKLLDELNQKIADFKPIDFPPFVIK